MNRKDAENCAPESLIDTIDMMKSGDYRERFKAEYYQLKIRIDRLDRFITEIETAREDHLKEPKHDCPLSVLYSQLNVMRNYETVLSMRARLEKIDL